MIDLRALLEASRDERRIERRIKDRVRKTLRTGESISTATLAANTGADVETVRRVVEKYLASPRLRQSLTVGSDESS